MVYAVIARVIAAVLAKNNFGVSQPAYSGDRIDETGAYVAGTFWPIGLLVWFIWWASEKIVQSIYGDKNKNNSSR